MSKQRSKVTVIVWIIVQQIFCPTPTLGRMYFSVTLMLSLAMEFVLAIGMLVGMTGAVALNVLCGCTWLLLFCHFHGNMPCVATGPRMIRDLWSRFEPEPEP